MCLLARHFESVGIPTLIMGSALDILEAGNPPRVQFLNFPLGFETGPFRDKQTQLDVVRQGLAGFESFTEPGIKSLPFSWDEGWELVNHRERNTKSSDSRSPRNTEPQYQTEEDRLLAEQ
ncbi:MAG: hypothetical protein O6945_06980 [Gammaproteobacteria bacterium]|nr:hypothetical protein [Gammaproteobacteria bacterium]